MYVMDPFGFSESSDRELCYLGPFATVFTLRKNVEIKWTFLIDWDCNVVHTLLLWTISNMSFSLIFQIMCWLKNGCRDLNVTWRGSSDGVKIDTIANVIDDKETDEQFNSFYLNTLNRPSTFISPVWAEDQLHTNLDLLLRLVNVKWSTQRWAALKYLLVRDT